MKVSLVKVSTSFPHLNKHPVVPLQDRTLKVKANSTHGKKLTLCESAIKGKLGNFCPNTSCWGPLMSFLAYRSPKIQKRINTNGQSKYYGDNGR